MKKLARHLVLKFLSLHARRRVSAKSTIVGITGSVGKTTAKDAAAQILASRFTVLANAKSFNSEFGVPLTLLEEESGFSNPLKWLGILWRAEWRGTQKLEAAKIVLELGADRPGDLSRLLEIVRPQIGVFLNVAPVHLGPGQFASLEAIAREKRKLIENLPKNGVAILNADDEFSRKTKTNARKIFFGLDKSANLRASKIREDLTGLSAQIAWGQEKAELKIPILGRQNLGSILAAVAIGLANGISLKKAISALKDFHLPPGRLNLLAGIKGSKILDGSYNSNPKSLAAALETLENLPAKRKIFLGGQMNELGTNSLKFHHELGAKAAKVSDLVIGVFGAAEQFVQAAKLAKKPTRFFETARQAGEFLKKEIRPGDLILAKGSQNQVRLEQALVKILRNPADRRLLCRQENAWKKR
ncbi:MAG: UDP-N-acetylmuramoyl-tripeptide--D-alanyl-D-alanine ligase [Patescibacteria group bacterium]